jgi:hypothetical protein
VLALKPDDSVAAHLIDGQWIIQLTDPATGRAQQELLQMMQLLQQVTIHMDRLDTATWSGLATMTFITAATYKFIHNTPYIREQFGQIWKLKTPPRVQIFL